MRLNLEEGRRSLTNAPYRNRFLRLQRKRAFGRLLACVGFAALALWMIDDSIISDNDWSRMGSLNFVMELISRFAPDIGYLPEVLKPLLDTILIAFLGTVLGLVLAVPVALLGARIITPFYPVGYVSGRFIMIISRSVHEIMWGLLFVSALGLGALPGILALGCRSVGFIAKTTSEAIENVNREPIRAVESSGAGSLQIFIFGFVPQVWPIFLGNAIFLFDMNLRRAAILGLVGAGGIGLLFSEHMMIFEYDKAATIVVAIVAVVLCGEIVSNRLRSRII